MRGAVFDFDGVLCDSMGQHAAAYQDVLEPLGVPVTPQAVYRLEGARSETIIRDLARAAHKHLDGVPGLAHDKQAAYLARGDPPLYPDALALVRRIGAATDHLGLVTGTRRENLERFFADGLPHFSAVLAQEDYRKDKPDPEPYTKAAERLGLDPADCLCLENATRGVQSAKAAGYGHVVGITTTMSGQDLLDAGADQVVASHQEASDAIVAWLGPT